METCIKEDKDYQRFYSGKVTSVGDVISMKVNTVVRGTLVNFSVSKGTSIGCQRHSMLVPPWRPASKRTRTTKDFIPVM